MAAAGEASILPTQFYGSILSVECNCVSASSTIPKLDALDTNSIALTSRRY